MRSYRSHASWRLFLSSTLFRRHDDWGQSGLLPSDNRHGTTRCIGILFHVWVEGLRLTAIYFKIADAAHGRIRSQGPLLGVSKLVDLRLFLNILSLSWVLIVLITTFGGVIRNLWHALRILWKRVGATVSQAHGLWICADRLVLRESLIHFP